MRPSILLMLSLGLMLFFGSLLGCTRLVGDDCDSSVDCETGQLCDGTLPGGYCTRSQCTFSGCPEEAICVEFNDFDSFCMLRCEGDGDCRDDYACIRDFAPAGFCGVPDLPEAASP